MAKMAQIHFGGEMWQVAKKDYGDGDPSTIFRPITDGDEFGLSVFRAALSADFIAKVETAARDLEPLAEDESMDGVVVETTGCDPADVWRDRIR